MGGKIIFTNLRQETRKKFFKKRRKDKDFFLCIDYKENSSTVQSKQKEKRNKEKLL